MAKYAVKTTVPVTKSKAEIEDILARYGASAYAQGWDASSATIMFEFQGYRIRFKLPLPDPDAQEFTHYRRGEYGSLNRRTDESARKQWEQACRQRWRALALCIKSKLEAVECGITTFEEEFLAHIVLPDGQTTGQWMHPQLEAAYSTGNMPPLLPAAG